ncbi:hypothetical protein TNCV_666521 [Trichonephila clavipes]|uniref:Uncharacterized protein n=1 Tax=Trichonephila clavipes TaxID=2585209 RepID=A0A8X6SKE5_TRICX|nr:hypothetical protein TNCV_666521 [Trichonephila clavipes]
MAMSFRRSPPKDPFPVRELISSQRSRGKVSKTGQSNAYVLSKSTFDLPLSSRQKETLRHSTTPQHTPTDSLPIDFQISLDSLTPTVAPDNEHPNVVLTCRRHLTVAKSTRLVANSPRVASQCNANYRLKHGL